MNLIECNHCEKKYALKLEKIPKEPKKWKCSSCRGVSPFPFYSEKEQEFLMNINVACQNCKKEYSIASSKFIASKMKVMCSDCKNKFEVHFSNFQNMQKLNQKISSYLNSEQEGNLHLPPKKESGIFQGDKNKLESLVKEVIPKENQSASSLANEKLGNENLGNENLANENLAQEPKKQEELFATHQQNKTSHLENFDVWENKIKEQKGVVPQDLRSHLFLSKEKEEKLDISLPSLPTVKKKKNTSKNIGFSALIFILFFLVVVIYIYLVKFL